MRVKQIFLIFAISFALCGSGLTDPIKVIIDTNVWGVAMRLFDHIIRESTSDPKPTYRQVWAMFATANSVESVLNDHGITEANMNEFSQGVLFTKRTLELQADRSNKEVDYHMPLFVYNEFTLGLSSKIGSPITVPDPNHPTPEQFTDFITEVPIMRTFDSNAVVEGRDYPTKNPAAKGDPALLKTEMEAFFTQNEIFNGDPTYPHIYNKKTNELLQFSGSDVTNKKISTRTRMDELNLLSENIRDKNEIWDKELGRFISSNGLPAYTSDSSRIYQAATKITNYSNQMKKLKYADPVPLLVDRLIKSDEEFDYFDLKIYLEARETGAHIMTFNTQAFQEINDPTFLDYFKDIKILHPEINFKSAADLDNSLCEDVLRSAIQNDFTREAENLEALTTVKMPSGEEINLDDFKENGNGIFKTFIDEYAANTGANFKKTLTENPIFSALNMLKKEGDEWKINTQIAFDSDVSSDITKSGSALKLLEKTVFKDRALTIDDFVRDTPTKLGPLRLFKNPTLTKALDDSQTNHETVLNEALEKFLGLIKGPATKDIEIYGKIVHILTNYEPNIIKTALDNLKQGPQKKPKSGCPKPVTRRRKRDIEECKLTWEDIDQVNEETEFNRDPEKVVIKSDEFIQLLGTIDDPVKRQQLCQFVEQLVEETTDPKIIGDSAPEVHRIVNQNKIVDHFSKVDQVSGALNTGVFAKNVLADFLSGDIKGIAVNVGFLAGDQAFTKIAGLAEVKGEEFVTSGKFIIGNTFKIASPFIKRLGSALVVYDMVEQINALEKGDKDAIVGVVGDGIMLSADAVVTGVEIAEAVGLIAEVSSVTGPVGAAIGAFVIVGTEVYFAVKHVEELDKVLHLSLDEKIIEGLNEVFHSPSEYLEELKEVKSANNQLAKSAMEYLQKQAHIQSIVFPAARYDDQQEKPVVSPRADVSVAEDPSTIRWDRTRPDDPEGGKVFCAQQDDEEGEVPPPDTTHICTDAIGITDNSPKENPFIVFNMMQTSATVNGFADHANVFIGGGSASSFTGANLNDIFSIKETKTESTEIDGKDGNNTLDVSGIEVDGKLKITFASGMCYEPCSIIFRNINRFVGRKGKPDKIMADCSTRYIDAQGGMDVIPDKITIPESEDCVYKLDMRLSAHTMVENFALLGEFNYFIDKDQTVTVLTQKPTSIERQKLLNTKHTFYLNYGLDYVSKGRTEFHENDIRVTYEWYLTNTESNDLPVYVAMTLNDQNAVIVLKDQTTLSLHKNGWYGMLKTTKTVDEIISEYPLIAQRLNATFYVQSDDGATVIVTVVRNGENVIQNDPEHETFILANHADTKNVFVIDTEGNSSPSRVTIFAGENQMNTLNLRAVVSGVEKSHGKQCLLLHSIDAEAEILEIELIEPDTLTTIKSITIKNFKNACEQWQIILHGAPVILKCDEQHSKENIQRDELLASYYANDHYTPLPLTVDATEIVVLTPGDIEPNMEIVVLQDVGDYAFVRFEDGLLVTNVLPNEDLTAVIRGSCSVMLKGYYDRPDIYDEITLKFNDKTISLDNVEAQIQNAVNFDDWWKDFYAAYTEKLWPTSE